MTSGTQPGFGAEPRKSRRARRACEGAARGAGVPASDRAGVWGGAPFNIGAEDWNRTSDTSIFSAVLYRLSYLGTPRERLAEPQSYQPDGATDKTREPTVNGPCRKGLVLFLERC